MFEFLLNAIPCIKPSANDGGGNSSNTNIRFKIKSSCCKKKKQVIVISSEDPKVIAGIMDHLHTV